MNRLFRRLVFGIVSAGLPLGHCDTHAIAQTAGLPKTSQTTHNEDLNEFRQAVLSWEQRPGPQRRVVDTVCLVSDVPTFLAAISTWDESHAFPILFDDLELSLKFIRAFKPVQIVRYPRAVARIPPERLWDAATAAVGRAWSRASSAEDRGAGSPAPRGNAPPTDLGPTPPGVVLSCANSPMLAGAVALAAGRFQPLIRWEIPEHFDDLLSRDQALDRVFDLEDRVAERVKTHAALGDDCDFLTLAGDWPYRYRDKHGIEAIDDLVGRSGPFFERWAYTGRLLGDSRTSVYRAMCSLFLAPESATLWNTYADGASPWPEYSMLRAASNLARGAAIPLTVREGNDADLSAWWRRFAPINRAGLVLINSKGSPTSFNLPGGPGFTGDIPPTRPAAVSMVHSYAASDPNDPETLAGRWLASGAFLFFGSMNEPYVQAFRPPAVLAELLARGVPLGAASRRLSSEPFGAPWRLVCLGDPLYTLPRGRLRIPRTEWDRLSAWPEADPLPSPAPRDATDPARLQWARQAALRQLRRGALPQGSVVLARVLESIERDRLEPAQRPDLDALLIDTLLEANRGDALLERLERIPQAGRPPFVERTLQSLQLAGLQARIAAGDLPGVLAFWSRVLESDPPRSTFTLVTERAARLAATLEHRTTWRARLQAARRRLDEQSPLHEIIASELRRLERQSADEG